MNREVVLYSRSECHLCDIAEKVLEEVLGERGWRYRKIDVDSRADLRSRFGEDVPVVVIEGEIAFQHRLNAQALETYLNDLPTRG
jgi:glutaredoxin